MKLRTLYDTDHLNCSTFKITEKVKSSCALVLLYARIFGSYLVPRDSYETRTRTERIRTNIQVQMFLYCILLSGRGRRGS